MNQNYVVGKVTVIGKEMIVVSNNIGYQYSSKLYLELEMDQAKGFNDMLLSAMCKPAGSCTPIPCPIIEDGGKRYILLVREVYKEEGVSLLSLGGINSNEVVVTTNCVELIIDQSNRITSSSVTPSEEYWQIEVRNAMEFWFTNTIRPMYDEQVQRLDKCIIDTTNSTVALINSTADKVMQLEQTIEDQQKIVDDKIKDVDGALTTGFLQIKEEIAQDINKLWAALDDVNGTGENLLLNGDFQVWQRGDTFTGGGYSADRWRVSKTAGLTIQIARHTDGMAIDLTGDGHVQLDYMMEEKDTYALKGKTLTLSYASTNRITVRARIRRGSDYTIIASDSDGKNLTFILDDIQFGDLLDICIIISQSAILNWVKLELGEFSTPFTPKPYGEELLSCQRFYKDAVLMGMRYGANSVTGKTYYAVHQELMPSMRRIPSIAFLYAGFINVGNIDDLDKVAAEISYNPAISRNSMSISTISYADIVSHNLIKVIVSLDAEMYS